MLLIDFLENIYRIHTFFEKNIRYGFCFFNLVKENC